MMSPLRTPYSSWQEQNHITFVIPQHLWIKCGFKVVPGVRHGKKGVNPNLGSSRLSLSLFLPLLSPPLDNSQGRWYAGRRRSETNYGGDNRVMCGNPHQ